MGCGAILRGPGAVVAEGVVEGSAVPVVSCARAVLGAEIPGAAGLGAGAAAAAAAALAAAALAALLLRGGSGGLRHEHKYVASPK